MNDLYYLNYTIKIKLSDMYLFKVNRKSTISIIYWEGLKVNPDITREAVKCQWQEDRGAKNIILYITL